MTDCPPCERSAAAAVRVATWREAGAVGAERVVWPAPEVGARLAGRGEICASAWRVGVAARAAGWIVVPTYARGFEVDTPKCGGGLAVPGERGAWCCPVCGREGAMTKFGAIRSHGSGRAKGWRRVESLALRMRLRMGLGDERRAVAVWHRPGGGSWGFDLAYETYPVLGRIGFDRVRELVSKTD